MASMNNDPIYLKVSDVLDQFANRVDESVVHQREQLKVNKKKCELARKLAEQRELEKELTAQLREVTDRADSMRQLCADMQDRLRITDSDNTRLQTAKEQYQIAKELTGVRWDFTAPPNIAKGYMKSPSRMLLEVFELDEAGADTALWAQACQMHAGRGSVWGHLKHGDKENVPSN